MCTYLYEIKLPYAFLRDDLNNLRDRFVCGTLLPCRHSLVCYPTLRIGQQLCVLIWYLHNNFMLYVILVIKLELRINKNWFLRNDAILNQSNVNLFSLFVYWDECSCQQWIAENKRNIPMLYENVWLSRLNFQLCGSC